MTLVQATLIPAGLLAALGALLLWNGAVVERAAKALPRSLAATVVLFGGAAAWFLWRVSQLGPADFGDYKQWLLLLFGGTALGAFFVAKDFLAVRGAAVLVLMGAHVLLYTEFLAPAPGRVWLNGFLYVCIIVALTLGTLPYLARDFFLWLWNKPSRARALGALCAAYAAVLATVAFSYPK